MTNDQLKFQAGFTLIETLMAMTIFSLLIVAFGGVFVSTLNLQKQAFNLEQVEENTNAVLEQIIKEIRVSEISVGDSSCPASPATSLTIVHPVNGTITYSLSGTDIHRAVSGMADTVISSNTVEFTRFNFCVTGSAEGDLRQPKVSIIGSVRSKAALQRTSMDFQTTVSQLLFND